jgi:hypothetical protein
MVTQVTWSERGPQGPAEPCVEAHVCVMMWVGGGDEDQCFVCERACGWVGGCGCERVLASMCVC